MVLLSCLHVHDPAVIDIMEGIRASNSSNKDIRVINSNIAEDHKATREVNSNLVVSNNSKATTTGSKR